MSDSVSLLQQNQNLTAETHRLAGYITAINQVTASVSAASDLDDMLQTALDAVVTVVGAEAAGISLIDEATGDVVLRAQKGWMYDFVVTNPMRIPMGAGMSGQVIANDEVLVYNNLDGSETYAIPSFREERFRSIALAPMHARGAILGILSIMSHQADRFSAEIVEVLRAIADVVGVAIDNARLYDSRVENENRLEAVLHSSADGIIATDQNSRINLVNRAAQELLDISEDMLLGVPLREAPIQKRARDRLVFALSKPDQSGSDSVQVDLENGRTVSMLISPIQVMSQVDAEVAMDGWVIVMQDITHLRDAEYSRSQFIQAAAHDMRNPLSIAQSSVRMLEEILGTDDETVNEIIGIANLGIRRLQGLIDDLLQIEKLESGNSFVPTQVDIREMCREIGEEVKPLMRNSEIDYEMLIQPDVPRIVELDRNWVNRAIHNYLENAVKYAQSGKIVRLHLFVQESMLHIEVVDNGPGIPVSAQSRLFERFYRVKETREIRGSGLGLAIVKSVAEAHGGRVYVRSKPDHGSTFGMAIPLTQAGEHA